MSLTIEFCRHPREADKDDGVGGALPHSVFAVAPWLHPLEGSPFPMISLGHF